MIFLIRTRLKQPRPCVADHGDPHIRRRQRVGGHHRPHRKRPQPVRREQLRDLRDRDGDGLPELVRRLALLPLQLLDVGVEAAMKAAGRPTRSAAFQGSGWPLCAEVAADTEMRTPELVPLLEALPPEALLAGSNVRISMKLRVGIRFMMSSRISGPPSISRNGHDAG